MEMVAAPALPRISIITPSFNQAAYLPFALNSVLEQNYPALEYLVMDGGSSDGSPDIVRRMGGALAYWTSAKDDGQADALRKGFERSTGEVLGWLNSDDLLLPGALHAVARTFQAHPEVGVVYGNRLLIDETGTIRARHTPAAVIPRASWAIGQLLCQECVFWRRSVYDEAGGLDPRWFFIMDFDLFYRMSRIARFRKIRRYLGCMRVHPMAKTARHDELMWKERAEAIRLRNIPQPAPVINKATRFLTRQLQRYERLASQPFTERELGAWIAMLGRQSTGDGYAACQAIHGGQAAGDRP